MAVQLVHFPHSWWEFPVRRYGKCVGSGVYDVPWNTAGSHFRRLVNHPGQYVNQANECHDGDLDFWTEWECETRAASLPRSLPCGQPFAEFEHSVKYPSVPKPHNGVTCCENTDPCVFGMTFKYCFCRQSQVHLRNLARGSVILFGSRNNGIYFVDTIFVVGASAQPYTLATTNTIAASQAYHRASLGPLIGIRSTTAYSFYRGATFAEPVNGMFSFTPARIHGRGNYHERCKVDLGALNRICPIRTCSNGLFNIDSCQRATVRVFDDSIARAVWTEIRRQVENNGFLLGTHFDWPTP